MKRALGLTLTVAFAMGVMAGPVAADKPDCNWGHLTKTAILDQSFEQGPHSSDPSGDGHGPGTADEPRAGLANVTGGKGDLNATCELIAGLLP